jgi:hypothetical protein
VHVLLFVVLSEDVGPQPWGARPPSAPQRKFFEEFWMPQKLTLVLVRAGWFSLFSSCPETARRPRFNGPVAAAKLIGGEFHRWHSRAGEGVMASEARADKAKGPLV